MAFKQDDWELSMAILAICDALKESDATRAGESLNKARKHAHRVLDHGKKKPVTPETPAEESETE